MTNEYNSEPTPTPVLDYVASIHEALAACKNGAMLAVSTPGLLRTRPYYAVVPDMGTARAWISYEIWRDNKNLAPGRRRYLTGFKLDYIDMKGLLTPEALAKHDWRDIGRIPLLFPVVSRSKPRAVNHVPRVRKRYRTLWCSSWRKLL